MRCPECDTDFADDRAQCPACGKWAIIPATVDEDATILLTDVKDDEYKHLQTGFWDPVFSEPPGIVTTSSTLMGGMPGAGKSTFALQFAAAVVKSTGGEVLYLPTEETPGQIKPRAMRLGISLEGIRFMKNVSPDPMIWASIVARYKSKAFILDSVDKLTGDVYGAVKAAGALKKEVAQKFMCPALIIAHINKQDDFAGLMKLQHEVDTLVGIRQDKKQDDRVIGSFKNRFGPTREVKMTMTEKGLAERAEKKKVGRSKQGK